MSLLFIEGPFFAIRCHAWWNYQIPVSVMAVKNLFHAHRELRIIGVLSVFKAYGCEMNETVDSETEEDRRSRGDKIPLCNCYDVRDEDDTASDL